MKVEIVPYNSKWPELFKKEKLNLLNLIPINKLAIEHIGSTAIPNIMAKPVIDIMIGVQLESELNLLKNHMTLNKGYIYFQKWEPQMPYRRLFVKVDIQKLSFHSIPAIIKVDDEQPEILLQYRTHHIHCVCIHHPFWKRHLQFRDHMRKNENDRMVYEKLKLKLAQQEWDNSADYSTAKSDFIHSIMIKLC